jgi:hypothetical protein
MKRSAIVAGLCVVALSGGKPLDGNELLKIQISPLVASAPAVITVRTVVAMSDDNRELEVTAQSPDFARRSTIELDGSASRVNVFNFTNLPAGQYDVSAVLMGANGVRATTARTVLVVPTPGSRR